MTNLEAEARAFTAAARWADDVVQALPSDRWDGPGLGDWNLRALVGHTSRALLTTEQYLQTTAETREIDSAEGYFEAAKAAAAQATAQATAQAAAQVTDAATPTPPLAPASVLQRGIDAGNALGEDPRAGFHTIATRVLALPISNQDQLIQTIAGAMRFSDYLATRTFELVVHGLDITRAASLQIEPPKVAVERALTLAASLALRAGSGPDVLLTLTGRNALASGFTVI